MNLLQTIRTRQTAFAQRLRHITRARAGIHIHRNVHAGPGSIAILCALLVLAGPALAQTTNATVTGTVSDAGGAAVPSAHVMVKNDNTGATQTVDSNTAGVYTAGQLLPGTYTVSTTRDGFEGSVDKGVVLTVNQTATLNITLRVGDVKQTVTVSAAAALINTSNAEISQVVDQHAIKELPLNGRDPSSLVLLSSGVTNVLNTAVGVLQTETTFPTESGASAGGGRQGSTYYLLDGAPNMDTYVLLAAPFPNADATQEFRVISNNFDSRYGYSPSAIVTIQTKSGANAFHGGAFEFLRNTDLNAADYFSHTVSTLKRNQFGGYVGGPILKDKLFFFANYQGTRATQAAGANGTFTPTAAMLKGDFSAVPFALKGGFATVGGRPNQINPALFDPASVKIATTALPLGQDPATGSVQFLGPANQQHFDEGTARIDYNLNQKQHLFVRSFTDYFNQIGGAINGNIVGNAILTSKPAKYFNEAFGWDDAISPSLVNNVTLFWNQLQVTNSGVGKDTSGNSVCLSKYIKVTEIPNSCYLEGLSVNNGFTTNYNEPTGEARTTYGLSDNVTKTLGSHTVSVGGNIWKQFAQETSQYPATPIVNFSNQFTGFGLADFLLGDVNQFTQGGGEIASVKGWQFGLYGQDQYRVRPNLTVTLGVRWDPNTPPASTGGRGSSFRPGQQSTRFPNAPLGEIFPGDRGLDSALQPTTYGYVQPRVGFSWQPRGLSNTVVRGGFGLFTSPLPYSSYNHVADIAPFSPTFVLNANSTSKISFSNISASFPGGVSPFPPFASLSFKPPTNSTFAGPVNLGATFSPNFRLGTTESWNLSLDQQFTSTFAMHLAYVASESYHLAQVVDNNPGQPAVYVATQSSTSPSDPRFNPLFGQILADTSLGTSPYHSLQVGVEQRLWHGLQFQSNFTWSKTIDLASTGNISFSNGLPDPFDIRHNRGISDLNVPLISVTNFVYTTPSLGEHGALVKNTLGGWEVSTIYTLQSGRPFGIVGGANGSNNSGALQFGDRADVVPGVNVEERQGSKENWINHYIPAGGFQANAPGTFGNSKRNLFTAPPTNFADMAFAKNWQVRERYGLQFRWELFNALNHTSFALPNNDPTSPSFGVINATGPVAPRVMQGALKVTF